MAFRANLDQQKARRERELIEKRERERSEEHDMLEK